MFNVKGNKFVDVLSEYQAERDKRKAKQVKQVLLAAEKEIGHKKGKEALNSKLGGEAFLANGTGSIFSFTFLFKLFFFISVPLRASSCLMLNMPL